MRKARLAAIVVLLAYPGVETNSAPVLAKYGMVVSQEETASEVGANVLREGGTAIDAAVATAFALAVTHFAAGNLGGGGFIVYRPRTGEPVAYDFREMAPARSSPAMFIRAGKYDVDLHHNSHVSVGVPGTVAGLHLAWREQGKLAWRRLVEPAIELPVGASLSARGLRDPSQACSTS
jgi:gamma-glutamyltranspeptidase / glutathione hydrolase